MTEPEKVNLKSMDIVQQKREQLKKLFPEALAENKIDFDQLRRSLGDWVAPSKERFGLNWPGPGKAACIKVVQTPSIATLKPCRAESVSFDNTDNLFIEGDNLEVPKLLQKSYFGMVKMIYIDPPYNTGKEFIYPDKYSETLATYLEYTGQKDSEGRRFATNTDTKGCYHSNWLNMMYPRLYLARNLLKEDGVIFISIDDHEQANLKALCDQVFGEENFVGQIVAQTNPRGRQLDKFLAKTFEYILVFGKNINETNILEIPKSAKTMKEYNLNDNLGHFRLLELRNRGSSQFNRLTRPNLYFPIYINPNTKSVSLIKTEEFSEVALPINSRNEDGCWTWSKAKIAKDINFLIAKQTKEEVWRVFRKDYIPAGGATSKEKTLWIDKNINHENGKELVSSLLKSGIFDFLKSSEIIKKVLRIGAEKDDLILDFFAGSATTAHAVMQLNAEDGGKRRYICVQLPEPCDCKTTHGWRIMGNSG